MSKIKVDNIQSQSGGDVTVENDVNVSSVNASGNVSAVDVNASGNVSGVDVSASGNVAGVDVNASGNVSAVDVNASGNVSATGTVTAQTFVGDGSGLQNVAGVTSRDRINTNKQVLKDEYLQGIANKLTTGAFSGNISSNLQGVVDYDSSHIGVRSDIFTDASKVSNTSSLTVNANTPDDELGSVQITQNSVPYGTTIGESTLATQASWSISGGFENYDSNASPILTYVYNADGTRMYAFVPRPFNVPEYPFALIEFIVNTPYDINTIQALNVWQEDLQLNNNNSWGDRGAFAMVNKQTEGYFEVQAINPFSNTVYQRYTIDESGPGSGVNFTHEFSFPNSQFAPLNDIRVHLTFNSDGTKAVIFNYSDDPSSQYEVISFDVSQPFSSNSGDYSETGRQSFSPVHTEFSPKHLALKLKTDGSGLFAYMMSNGEGFHAFEVSLTNFVADSNTSVVNQSFKASNDNVLTETEQAIGYDGLFFISGDGRNDGRQEFIPFGQLSVAGLGDIQSPASFERSIDLTNDLDSPPTSVMDANVTISVDISDGTNTVTITQLDTEVDCSALTSRTLTATWNLSVSNVQGTNAKIENYALNFR